MVVDKDITIAVAQGAQIEEFQRLLFRVYCLQLGWHDPKKFPDGVFTDMHDRNSIFLTVSHRGQLISGLRLVADGAMGFPHEHTSFVSLPDLKNPIVDSRIRSLLVTAGRQRIREVTRFIGDSLVRRVHMYDLLKALYWFGMARDIEFYFMAIDVGTFLLARKLGFEVIPVGTPFVCEGSWSMPAVIYVPEIAPAKSEMRGYFFNTSNLCGI